MEHRPPSQEAKEALIAELRTAVGDAAVANADEDEGVADPEGALNNLAQQQPHSDPVRQEQT